MPTICMFHLPPAAIWGICKSAAASAKAGFFGLPHGVNNDIAGKHGKMINSSADDKRAL